MKFVYRSDLPSEKRSNHVNIGTQSFTVVDGAVDLPDGLVQGRLDEFLAHGFTLWAETPQIDSPTLQVAQRPGWNKKR